MTMRMPELKIASALTLSISFLVLMAVGLVLYVQWNTSRKIMTDLVGQVAMRNLEFATQGITGHLDPVRKQVEFLADFVENGAFTVEARKPLADLLMGSVAGLPQIGGVMVLGSGGLAVRIRRADEARHYEAAYLNLAEVPAFQVALKDMRARKSGYWGHLFYRAQIDTTFITYRRPLRKNGRFIGMIAAFVSIKDLSRLASNLGSTFGNTMFLMQDEEKVLAHPRLTESVPRIANSPTVSVAQLGDRVISSLGRAVPSKIADPSTRTNAQFFELKVGGVPYFLLRKSLDQFGDPPFMVGIYGPAERANAPLQPLYFSAVIGLVILLVALISTALLSQAIAQPIRRMTDSVTKVGRFSSSAIEAVPEAWIREVGDLARSFNGMLNGLRYFETYVPQKLVQRLIKQEGGAEVVSEERELTVMFTDIADFTGLCEDMTAQEVADFLNTHFTLLGKCVEDEGGTIDKYIGDSLMAFWGAPEQLENAVEKACRAARAIAAAMAEENQRRVAQGRAPVRIRLGVHTGPLVVGNIGSPSRINYTVVGDTVNAAQRLESLGKALGPNDATIILISEATMRKLPDEFQTTPAGSFPVKGRSETITVHRLIV